MKCINISWSRCSDITKVSHTKEFEKAGKVAQLDVLSDAIAILTKKYNSLLTQENSGETKGKISW